MRFSNGQEVLSLTTAAQNIHVLFRKSPLCRSHFFKWLKTAISSNACGTVTLKSPPSRGSDAPHVHPRLRKRRSRCTLDCGFKTSESPALRGFVGEGCPIRGTSLYLVLLSNGLHHPKIRLKKFGFSLKTVPANIAKKLPLQRCSKQFLIPIFNFPHKRPTFVFAGESGYTLGFQRKIAHKGLHGETGAFRTGPLSLPSERSTRFGNPAWPDVRTANFAAFWPWSGVFPKNTESLRDSDALMRVAVPRRRGPAGLRDLFRFCRNRDLYIRRSWFSACARHGWYHYPRRALRVAETPDGRLSKRLVCRFLASPIYICERPCRIEKDRLRFR